jgi:small subunit ribosomal protein S11
MGKKKIIQQSGEELVQEKEKVELQIQSAAQKLPSSETFIKKSKATQKGRVYIQASYNNTIISVTDDQGNVLTWASSGNLGFKGSKKATPFAASRVAEVIAERMHKLGVKSVDVFVKGIGSGRESAVRSLSTGGIEVLFIKDITPIPHNGVRPVKTRRV